MPAPRLFVLQPVVSPSSLPRVELADAAMRDAQLSVDSDAATASTLQAARAQMTDDAQTTDARLATTKPAGKSGSDRRRLANNHRMGQWLFTAATKTVPLRR
jgi:hypothetical protein